VPRAPYYEREIEVRFSRSYGPGRYDREYEERGLDYPIGYVRWTEQRNMAAFVELVASRRIDVAGLVLARVAVDDAADAYERLVSADVSPLGVVLSYEATEAPAPPRTVVSERRLGTTTTVNVIGAGSFAQRILIPGLRKAGFRLGAVASAKGLSAKAAADRFGFARTAGVEEAIADPEAGLVAIATRHASHASLAEAALRAGKAVFVEKPPCLTFEELGALRAARAETDQPLFVGFNRRHAPLAIALRDHVREPGAPVELLYRVNAGPLPSDHWLADLADGGGRLLGEGCHFVDFACWVVGAPPVAIACTSAGRFALSLGFPDGSVATILYAVGGADGLAKEYVEAHAGGRSACLDDFRALSLHGGPRRRSRRRGKQDKGHLAQFAALLSDGGSSRGADVDPLDSMASTLEAASLARGEM
jgi:predicted dehydrogenase